MFLFTDDTSMQGENSKIHTQKSKISKVINKSQRLQDEKSMYNILMAGWKNLIKSKVAKNGYRERLKLKKKTKKKKKKNGSSVSETECSALKI